MRNLELVCLILTIMCTAWSVDGSECKNAEKYLSQEQNEFLSCAVKSYNLSEFKICFTCALSYTQMTKAFDEMHAVCNETGDPFNTLVSVHTVYTQLWTQANCDECLLVNNSTATHFSDQYINFNNCRVKAQLQLCVTCRFEYDQLKTLYTDMEKETHGKVCYDLKFMMNQARMVWSKKCQRQSDLFLFFIPAALVLCLTIAFYVTNIWITKRQERNNELLYNIDAETRNRAQNISVNGHTTSSQIQPSGIIEAEILAIDPPLKSSHLAEDSDDDSHYSDDAPMLS